MNRRSSAPSTERGAARPSAHQPHERPAAGAAQPKTSAVAQAARRPAPPPVYRPQSAAGALQPKASDPAPKRQPPAAPPVYRPEPKRVAQANPPRPTAPLVSRPATPPVARRPGVDAARPQTVKGRAETPAAARPVVQRKAAAQLFKPGVVQAAKFYPNLHPGAVERVEPGSLFRLESFTDQYRLRRPESHGVYVPNQQYNFVRTIEGQTLLHNRYRHPSIAEGRQVLYAGEVTFNNGRLQWWSNGSGHYQPDADDAAQAGLPMDQFFTYQQVIKGEHKRRPSGRG